MFLFGVADLQAHYCGPPVIRCKPGDIITYYILSDRAEEGISGFSVFNQTHPEVAPVIYYTPVGRIYGQFIMRAQQVGTNNIALFWNFPPNSASGFCVFEVWVRTNATTTTAGNNPDSAYAGDPVNAYSGEFVLQEPPDLFLGGPMPLYFSRYYASRLQADSLVNSRLGNNWSHNFEWRALTGVTNEAVIISPRGFNARFAKSGTNWVLQSPTTFPFQLVNSGTNWVFGDPRNNRLYTFNTNNGFLTSISDGKGNTHSLTYSNDTLVSVSDGLGRTLTFDYVGAQTISKVSDGTRSVHFLTIEIGNQLNLLYATDALGNSTSYSYDNTKSIGSLLTSVTDPLGHVGYTQAYDDSGRVIQQTRLGTNVTRFAYAPESFTTYVTNAAGAVSAYVHSPAGEFLSLTDAAGKALTISTNAQGRRAGILDRTGASVGVAYDAATGRPAFFTNADGTVTAFTYTNRTVNGIVFNELASAMLPDGSREQYTYDAAGNLVAVRDRVGNVVRMGYNSRGQILAVTNAAGGVATNAYNPDGTLAAQGNAESGAITFLHDSLRRATNATASDGRSIGIAFDANDRITVIRDERTNRTFFAHDAANRLVAVTNALGQVTRFNFDPADRIASVTDREGRNVSFAFDPLDQVAAVTNRNGNRIQIMRDARQRLTSILDAANKPWSFGYNDEDAVTSYSNPLGQTTQVARDAAGFISAVSNALGRTTLLNRDVMHRVTAAIDPLGRLDRFGYEPGSLMTNVTISALGPASSEFNALGLLTRLTDQRGGQWLFHYSALGRLTDSVDPLNRTTTVNYDSRGRPLRFAFADGASQTNGYDASGNLASLGFSDGSGAAFGYDALHRVTNAPGLAIAYDAEDRVTNTVSAGIAFGAAFDAGGRMTNATYNNGAFSVAYTYDSRDRLTRVRDSLAGAQVDFLYDDAGRLTNVVRANGINGVYDYNALGQVWRIREGAFLDLQYGFDAAGQIESLNANAPLSPSSAPPQTNVFAYDAAQQISGAGFSYDQRGRLVNAPGHVFAWNAASQLVRADTVTNTYNGAGNVLTRGVSGGVTRFHYNHAINRVPIMAEQNAASGSFLRYYVWTPDGRLLYMIDAANGNAVYYFHFDLTGSTLALTSAAGAVTDAYAYTPYGVLAARTGANPQPFTYVGQHGVRWDSAAGLYQMRARYYDPVTARFISRDPLWPRSGDGWSVNPYAYAANNPLQFIDPMGTRTELETASPVLTLDREEISRAGETSVSDLLSKLPASPSSAAPGQPVKLRGLAAGQTLVLLNGRRMPSDNGAPVDINSIPVSEIERVEVLTQGASAVYGSDAIGAVVNVITKKPATEFNFTQLNVGWNWEPDFKVVVRQTPANGPPKTAPPQPTRLGGQLLISQMVPEMMMVASYGVMIQRGPFGLRVTSNTRDYLQAALLLGPTPSLLRPLGVAFVNGQFVNSKPQDILYGMFLKDDLYADLWYYGISPEFVYDDFITSLMMGGSGGAYADWLGYRAVGVPPLF